MPGIPPLGMLVSGSELESPPAFIVPPELSSLASEPPAPPPASGAPPAPAVPEGIGSLGLPPAPGDSAGTDEASGAGAVASGLVGEALVGIAVGVGPTAVGVASGTLEAGLELAGALALGWPEDGLTLAAARLSSLDVSSPQATRVPWNRTQQAAKRRMAKVMLPICPIRHRRGRPFLRGT